MKIVKTVTINEKFKRSNLNEGRQQGLSFVPIMLNSTGSSKLSSTTTLKKWSFNTLMPLSACKEYLNDFLNSETYNIKVGSIYGYEYKKITDYLQNDYAYMFITSIPKTHASDMNSYNRYITDLVNLQNHWKNIPSLLNGYLKQKGVDKEVEVIGDPCNKNTIYYANDENVETYKEISGIVVKLPIELFEKPIEVIYWTNLIRDMLPVTGNYTKVNTQILKYLETNELFDRQLAIANLVYWRLSKAQVKQLYKLYESYIGSQIEHHKEKVPGDRVHDKGVMYFINRLKNQNDYVRKKFFNTNADYNKAMQAC